MDWKANRRSASQTILLSMAAVPLPFTILPLFRVMSIVRVSRSPAKTS
ncbi:hypothetical protein NDQ57_00510 [Rossellomorea marisflavi]|nr:hypothetical protein [Rossellomorea marisflavi]MCM2603188.1 hypothetical protein [Rossellomorea marisflavi]